jgi:DNA (cytosine-5)-methyltransferase 1
MAKRKITQLDLFSGIGGFHLGFERAGYEVKSYYSEIDKHAVAVYKQQFKDAEYVGSVTDVRGAELPTIDLITFGSPCQDFSLAGKRKGMQGERSSLVLEAIRLINECRPSVFIWENVKGTFSSNNGADFWAIIQAFANIGGYRLEWQLLNTSWVLPQNRERVYVVGYSTTPGGDWRGVFPIGESAGKNTKLSGHNLKTNTLLQRYEAGANGSYISECKQPSQEIKVKSATSKEAVVEPTTCRGGLQKNAAHFKEKSPALTSAMGMGGGHTPIVDQPNYRIRRLTPIECERLQGFPDNHTEYGNYDGEVKKMSNTQRYKQCGNAVTVDIVALVAEAVKPLLNRTV